MGKIQNTLNAMSDGRLGERRIKHLAQRFERCIGMRQAKTNDFTQSRRKLAHGFRMANLFNCFLELQKRVHRFALICNFRVRRAVRVVADALVKARVLEMQRAGVRTP